MGKEAKTNACRILDKNKVKYDAFTYECDEFVDGVHSADYINAPYEQSFKTIVVVGKTGNYYVLVVPINEEIDRKKTAKVVGEKSIDLIPVKDITKITGYVRGGCSPIGMKKNFPVVFHNSVNNFNEIYFSGGRLGLTLKVPVKDAVKVTNAKVEDIIAQKES